MVLDLNASGQAPSGGKVGNRHSDETSRVRRSGRETQVNLRTGHARWAYDRVIIVDGDGDDLSGAVHGMDGESIGYMLVFTEFGEFVSL